MAAPRKITIKLRPVGAKPPEAKPAEAAASAPTEAPIPETPAPEPAVAAAPTEEPEMTPISEPEMAPIPEAPSAPMEPVAAPAASTPPPKPSKPTIVLKKVGAPAPEAAPAPTPASASAEQAKRQTSRIELPPELSQRPADASENATIKLKPISQSAAPAPEENPQAAKSKTARIALDSVLGGIQSNTPLANTTQKTIKLKRSTPTPTAKPTASAPMAPVGDSASEEKTIKLKRPAALGLKKEAPKPTPAEPELEALEELEELPPMVAAAPVAESTGAKIFTITGVVAAAFSIIATIVLCLILQKQAASPDGSEPTGNTLHAFSFQRL